MHVAERGYLLIVLAAILAIVAIWSADPAVSFLWGWPLLLLLGGIAIEGALMRRAQPTLEVTPPDILLLGRDAAVDFSIQNPARRFLQLQYAPVLPAQLALSMPTGVMRLAPAAANRGQLRVTAVRLGAARLPAWRARLLGRFSLAWWDTELATSSQIEVVPDSPALAGSRTSAWIGGGRSLPVAGAGFELLQLRPYRSGDPLGRIDWKSSARSNALVSREYSEDRHLEVVIALDAGRLSRLRAGHLDRYGLYTNVAARFAERLSLAGDRVGLVVFADVPLIEVAPTMGYAAVRRLRDAMASISAQPVESDPFAAAAVIRRQLRRRSLVVMLSDFGDSSGAEGMLAAQRLLTPPHLMLVGALQDEATLSAANGAARHWLDPWRALAAREQIERMQLQAQQMTQRGAAVVLASERQLGDALMLRFGQLRRQRRI
ncbi:MAG: DUF58 domain-containing protein [Steroidobacteraceae bacterium]